MKTAIDTPPLADGVSPAATLELAPLRRPRARVLPGRLNDFYELTKPRMNVLVVLTTLIGFCVASRGAIDWLLLLHTVLGTALCAGCASVLNQFIEREHDGKMPRTLDRPLPAGRVRPWEALLYGIVLGVAGVAYLLSLTNPLTAALGLITIVWYLALYTPAKRFTTLNTVIGAVPGAIPPMMGFTAATGAITPGALAVFGILFFWQMPHFLAIAILYRNDYAAGGFKMLPVVDKELHVTSRQIVLYAAVLIPVSLSAALLRVAGNFYAWSALMLGLAFLSFAITAAATRTRSDARWLFVASIVYLPLVLAAMMIDKM